MARPVKRFVCQSCGAVASKWSGRCESCGEWNTIAEEAGAAPGPAGAMMSRGQGGKRGRLLEFTGLTGSTPQPPRYKSGIDSFLTSLDAQRTLYAAQQNLVTSRLQRETNLVTLYSTLGGGLTDGATSPPAA